MTRTRPVATDAPADSSPLGLRDIATLLGVEWDTARKWLSRDLLPPPDFVINDGEADTRGRRDAATQPVWQRRTILRWARETGRLAAEDDGDK